MAKLSPEYAFSLLKSMNDEEKSRFLKQLEQDPLLPSATESSSSADAPATHNDYGLPPAVPTTSKPPPAASPPASAAEVQPDADHGGDADPTGPTLAGTAGGGTAGNGGNGVATAKKPEVKEPPPKPPSSSASAPPPLEAKSLATPPKPASATGAPTSTMPRALPAAKERRGHHWETDARFLFGYRCPGETGRHFWRATPQRPA
ncbi:unnamed protein product [Symbiodinium sp. CCMP2592]|nr:unnamed protein product [Symbiodinium sp. CCMP2592]